MKITSVTITKNLRMGESSVKGYASIVLDEVLTIRNIRIVQGKTNKNPFLVYPKRKSGKKDIADVFPIKDEFRKEIESAILTQFGKEL